MSQLRFSRGDAGTGSRDGEANNCLVVVVGVIVPHSQAVVVSHLNPAATYQYGRETGVTHQNI